MYDGFVNDILPCGRSKLLHQNQRYGQSAVHAALDFIVFNDLEDELI